ncbi:MAG: hypothetical protein Satyrvirus1_16 [Satyrvirus sp.]|uniref:Uncharacterized protein n=1 Tax=Satyrvirus sp. TaxID=2487771 RepID=A0A3G5ACN2_9VIRU|nr:MAG: hypothetical protein Satyrvirus1_16 [Satyrvirus sp.]
MVIFGCSSRNTKTRFEEIGFMCPVCFMKTCGIVGYLDLGGKCGKCNCCISLNSKKYCAPCSILLGSCHWCGDPIKNGNDYIVQMQNVLDDKINKGKNLADKYYSDCIPYDIQLYLKYVNYINNYFADKKDT